MFGRAFWDNVVLCASFWPYDQHSIDVRNSQGKTEEWWAAEMNSQLQKRFHLDRNLTVSRQKSNSIITQECYSFGYSLKPCKAIRQFDNFHFRPFSSTHGLKCL